jgi:hypothetical protein
MTNVMSSVCGTPRVNSLMEASNFRSSARLPEGASCRIIASSLSLPNIFVLIVPCVGDAVRMDHQDIAFGKAKLPGFERGEIKHPDGVLVGRQPFDLSRAGAENACGLVSGADELPSAIRTQDKKKSGDELTRP